MKARIQDGVVYSPFPSCEIPRCSFYTAAKERLARTPSKRALVDDTVTLSRSELLARLQRYGAGFQAHGIGYGDRVCVHLSNSVENFVAMFGCIVAGATVILAKITLTASTGLHVLTGAPVTSRVRFWISRRRCVGLFVMGDAPGFVSASKFRDHSERAFQEVKIADPENTVLALCYTSGTTGLPKGVEITHYSFVGNIYTSAPCMSSDDSDIVLANSPITHGSGLLLTMAATLLGGTCVIASPFLSPEEICDAVNKHQITAMFLFPTRLQALVRAMQRTGERLCSVRRIGVGGSPLSAELAAETLGAFGGAECLMNMYGMSESCGILCSPSMAGVKHTDLGFPAAMTKIRIVDVHTRKTLGPNEVGELEFKIPIVTRGYYKKPEATAALKGQDGWCRSGKSFLAPRDQRVWY
ncbi:unnamed protein product [Ixodes hexagonus]